MHRRLAARQRGIREAPAETLRRHRSAGERDPGDEPGTLGVTNRSDSETNYSEDTHVNLKEQRAALVKEANELVGGRKAKGEDLTAEDRTRLQAIVDEVGRP